MKEPVLSGESYVATSIRQEIVIRRIVTVHYFEHAKDFIFEGERHNFWEFLYVDKGEVEVMADNRGYVLHQGEIIFHQPNEFHNVWANGRIAPNVVVMSFVCSSPAMKFFAGKILRLGDEERDLLAQGIREAREAYASPLHTTTLKKLEKRPHSLFGSEQLIKLSLEALLIRLTRDSTDLKKPARQSTSIRERSDTETLKKIIRYLEEHVRDDLKFNDVCRMSCLCRTNLKALFRERTGLSVMEYYRGLKIEAARQLIREGNHNFTEIAELLRYSTIHYFSRHFKKATGMTPSEYATSVMAKV